MSIMDDTTFEDKTMPAENYFTTNGGPINDPDDLLAILESRPLTETNHYAVLNVSKFVWHLIAYVAFMAPSLRQR